MNKDLILNLLQTFSLTYLDILRLDHQTSACYLVAGHNLRKISYKNNLFTTSKDIEIVVDNLALDHVTINGSTYWKDQYGVTWFIFEEKIFTRIFGTGKSFIYNIYESLKIPF